MRAVFSNRAYASVLAETTEKIKTETGGLFLGTIQNDTWYIIESIDPGPKSIFEVAYFEYDQKYTKHLINKIANLYDTKFDLIGLWHRHPGSFDQFSSTDDGTNTKYASMREEGAISALVNIDPTFRITMYQVERPCNYQKIAYDVGDNLIPDDLLKFKTPESFFDIMNNILYSSSTRGSSAEGYHKSISLASFMSFILPQLKNSECAKPEDNGVISVPVGEFIPPKKEHMQEMLIDEVIDDITFMADSIGIETSIFQNEYNGLTVCQEAIDETTKLSFSLNILESTVVLSYNNKLYNYRKGLFTEAFGKAKAERERKGESESRVKPRKQAGVIDSVIKIIRFNRNEE